MTASLEALMLTAFSASWYWSVWKMIRTGNPGGKSLGFILLIVTGYGCGIASKLSAQVETGHLSPLIWLYCWNLAVISFDAWLAARLTDNPRRSREAASGFDTPRLPAGRKLSGSASS